MTKKGTVLVIVAHNDDHIVGAGGTLAKYAQEGKKVKTIIFSYGEKSHPHLKPKVIMEKRYEESLESDKILGGSGLVYLGLKEGRFMQQYKKRGIKKKLAYLIRRQNPEKIFTLGPGDVHPDHNAVWRIVQDLIKDGTIKCDVYAFEVWSAVQTFKRDAPKLVVDVSDTYALKVKALKAHKSQAKHIFPFIPVLRFKMWLHALSHGWAHGFKYAEEFYKLN
ncbi:MAG: PIG-L deacetylase family protein [Candidatus Woesearchaeota archaeon]